MWVSWGAAFLCLELLLVEEDVTALKSEVYFLCACLLKAFCYNCSSVSLHGFPQDICCPFVVYVLYIHHSINMLPFLFFLSLWTFPHLVSGVFHRLAHLVWHDSAQHSRLLLTRPVGYPLRQLKIWRPCLSLTSPSASTGWTGFARASRWPAHLAKPSFGHQVSPLPALYATLVPRTLHVLCSNSLV